MISEIMANFMFLIGVIASMALMFVTLAFAMDGDTDEAKVCLLFLLITAVMGGIGYTADNVVCEQYQIESLDNSSMLAGAFVIGSGVSDHNNVYAVNIWTFEHPVIKLIDVDRVNIHNVDNVAPYLTMEDHYFEYPEYDLYVPIGRTCIVEYINS